MIKLAQILNINQQEVILRLQKKTGCSDCKSGCSDGFLDFIFKSPANGILSVALKPEVQDRHLRDTAQFFAENHYKKDDIIGIEFQDSQVMNFAIMLYGLPILMIVILLLCGYSVFSYLGLSQDIGGVIGATLGILISRYLIKRKYHNKSPEVRFFK